MRKVISGTGLESFAGFDHVTVTQHLEIDLNPALTGLPPVRVAPSLALFDISGGHLGMPKFASVTSASELTEVQHFHLESLPMLQSLQGLEGLRVVHSDFHVARTGVSNLRPLEMLQSAARPRIDGNEQLPACEVERLSARLGWEPIPAWTNGPAGTCAP